MPVQIDIEFPADNAVTLSRRFLDSSNGTIEVRGRGNVIEIDDPLIANSARFFLSGGATLRIGPHSNLGALNIHALAAGAIVELGTYVSFQGVSLITAHEPSRITIGDYCLFGDGCLLASSDVHHIIDAKTKQRLNPAEDILIEEHVWAAPRVAVLRKSWIGRDSVIGYGSVVKGIIPRGVLAAGVPARVVREGITWSI